VLKKHQEEKKASQEQERLKVEYLKIWLSQAYWLAAVACARRDVYPWLNRK